jgi:[NiFe] hydrogenase diaphorase moiety large subunit
VGNVLLRDRLNKILQGKGEPADLDYLKELGESIKLASRCGLGQTSANPVLTTLKNFRPLYEARVKPRDDGMVSTFDIHKALKAAEKIAARTSVVYNH